MYLVSTVTVARQTFFHIVTELRKALGNTVRTPRFIATVHRRGYRFIAPAIPVTPALGASEPLPSSATTVDQEPASAFIPWLATRPHPAQLVEREAVLTHLHAALVQARQGMRQVVFGTGEPGIGKTTVVEAFLPQAVAETAVWVAHGQCVE